MLLLDKKFMGDFKAAYPGGQGRKHEVFLGVESCRKSIDLLWVIS